MSVKIVQTKSTAKTSGSNQSTSTWSSNTTTGNLIVLVLHVDSLTANPTTSVTDSQSNTYNKIFSTTTDGVNYATLEIWVAYNITGGTTPTITANFSGTQITGMIHREYAGIPATAVVDRSVSTAITAGTLSFWSAYSSVTTSPYELCVIAMGDNNGSNTFTATTGSIFRNAVSLDVGSTFGCAIADAVLTGITSERAMFTASPNTAVGVVGLITIPATKDNLRVSRTRPHPFSPGLAK